MVCLENLSLIFNDCTILNLSHESKVSSLGLTGVPWITAKDKNESFSFQEITEFLSQYHIFNEQGLWKWKDLFDSCDEKQAGYLDFKGLQKFNAHLILFGNPCRSLPATLFQLRSLTTLDLKRQALKEIGDDIIHLINLQKPKNSKL